MSVTVVLLVASGLAHARDPLESIIKKDNLTDRDLARIEGEVSDRVKKLADAGDRSDRRQEARDALLGTVKIRNASQVALNAYAQACDSELGNLVTSSRLNVAFDAALILVDLQSSQTTRSLARALLSEHAAVRYRAARGIQMLHEKIAANQDACSLVLNALGRAGAAEKDEHVLRMIYEAINFHADVQGFQYADDCARALNEVLAARVAQLKGGSRDEWKDEAGYKVAEACYPGASRDRQRELLLHTARLLGHYVDRFFDKATAGGYLQTLKGYIQDVEKVIHGMMRESKINPPSNRVSEYVRSRPSSTTMEQGKAAYSELTDALVQAGLVNQNP